MNLGFPTKPLCTLSYTLQLLFKRLPLRTLLKGLFWTKCLYSVLRYFLMALLSSPCEARPICYSDSTGNPQQGDVCLAACHI